MLRFRSVFFFFFNDTATTEIYTLSLHDALPILFVISLRVAFSRPRANASALESTATTSPARRATWRARSEEHTSELQSQSNLVCRLLLEKKNSRAAHLELEAHRAHGLAHADLCG